MAGQRAMFTGVDAILGGWDTFIGKYPYYALSNAGGIIWQGDDSAESRRELADMLQASEQSNNSDIYYLIFYEPGVKVPVTNRTDYTSKCPVRVVEAQMGRGAVGSVREGDLPAVVYRGFQEMEKLPSILANMQKQIDELASTEVADTTVMGKIGSFLQTPEFLNSPVGAMAVEKIFGLLGMAGLNKPVPNMAVGKVIEQNQNIMAGDNIDVIENLTEEQNVQLDKILARLAKHCHLINDLDKLASIAENNPAFFNSILGTLRSMP